MRLTRANVTLLNVKALRKIIVKKKSLTNVQILNTKAKHGQRTLNESCKKDEDVVVVQDWLGAVRKILGERAVKKKEKKTNNKGIFCLDITVRICKIFFFIEIYF